jgi:hypothetical protein
MKNKPKGKKAKNKEVNPTKQRIWNLDALRVNDMLAMKSIRTHLIKQRKKIEPKATGGVTAKQGSSRPNSAPFKKK